MKIAVISDIHDNYYSFIEALKIVKEQWCEQILFLWDLWHGRLAKFFADFDIPTKMIRWNNDWEITGMLKISMSPWSNLQIISSSTYSFCEFAWKKIFMTHYKDLSDSMAKSGEYDVIFYWHEHIFEIHKIWDCLVCCPWEIVWWENKISSFVIYNTESNEIKKIEVKIFLSQIWTVLEKLKELRNI